MTAATGTATETAEAPAETPATLAAPETPGPVTKAPKGKRTPKKDAPQVRADTELDKTGIPRCECGCGGATRGGRFQPGHDARLKSQILRAIRNADAPAAERVAAMDRMHLLGWAKFVREADIAAVRAAEAAEVAK